jgi:hypothetical protein
MQLDALPVTDADRLLTQLLRTEVPAGVRELVVERAEGNPFFVEELVATLIDRGLLLRSNGGWTFGAIPAGFSLPDSVQAVVAARIDLLPDAEKVALQAAAVIGRTFWSGPLYELLDGASPEQNLDTPCPFNVGILLIAARAMAYGGQEAVADRLQDRAVSIGMVGYEEFMAPRWLGLSMARGDATLARQTIESIPQERLILGNWELVAALLDALAALGDWQRIEAEAPRWVRPEGYVAAMAVKALGMARRSPELLSDAVARFAAMGATWHAERAREALQGLPPPGEAAN